VKKMLKFELVRALEYEHPTRVLEIGAVNSNVSRAWTKDAPVDMEGNSIDLRPLIKLHLRKMAKLSSEIKRTCHTAIGLYVEGLSSIDESDKLILSSLCDPFTTAEAAEGKLEEGDDDITNAGIAAAAVAGTRGETALRDSISHFSSQCTPGFVRPLQRSMEKLCVPSWTKLERISLSQTIVSTYKCPFSCKCT